MEDIREDELLEYYKVPPEVDVVPATYTPISPEERKRRVAELNQKVAENIERLQNSDEFHQYLIAMSRFHNYSWNNQMLIWLQKVEATHVAGYNTWRDLGRYVKKGEAGIMILAPLGPTAAITWYRATDQAVYSIKRGEKGWDIYDNMENLVEEGFPSYAAAAQRLKGLGFVEKRETLTVNNFKVVHVFDISQTEGKPLPEFDVPVLTGEANQWLFDTMLDVAKQKVTVNFDPMPKQSATTKGFFRPPDFIWIRPEEAPAQQLNALLHELSHYFTESVFQIPRKDAETIAECAACVIGSHYGFDTGTRSFPYVALWAKDPKTLHSNIDTIQKVANKIITEIEARQTRLIPMTASSEAKQIERAEMKYTAAEIREMACKHGITGDSKRDLCRKLIELEIEIGREILGVKGLAEPIIPPLQETLADCESKHSTLELKEMARKAGLETTGSKLSLCRALINKGVLK